MDSTRQVLVNKLEAGDQVYLGSDHPTQLTEVAHLGGGLVILYATGGREYRKDSREVVYVPR